jgi:gephyrin
MLAPVSKQPHHAQDGYAVVAADGEGTFPVVGEVRAGGAGVNVAPGSVAYITTGAPVPDGADAVIQIEDTERVPGAAEVTIRKAARAGQDMRTVGSDIEKARCGDELQHAGCRALQTLDLGRAG